MILYAIEKKENASIENINYSIKKEIDPLYIFNANLSTGEIKKVIAIESPKTQIKGYIHKLFERVTLSDNFYGYRISANYKTIPMQNNADSAAEKFYITSGMNKIKSNIWIYVLVNSDGYIYEGYSLYDELSKFIKQPFMNGNKILMINIHGKKVLSWIANESINNTDMVKFKDNIYIKKLNIKGMRYVPNINSIIDMKLQKGFIKLRDYNVPCQCNNKITKSIKKNIKVNRNNNELLKIIVAGCIALKYDENYTINTIKNLLNENIDINESEFDKKIKYNENEIIALKIYKELSK